MTSQHPKEKRVFWSSIHNVVRRLTAWSLEVSKSRYWCQQNHIALKFNRCVSRTIAEMCVIFLSRLPIIGLLLVFVSKRLMAKWMGALKFLYCQKIASSPVLVLWVKRQFPSCCVCEVRSTVIAMQKGKPMFRRRGEWRLCWFCSNTLQWSTTCTATTDSTWCLWIFRYDCLD